jgi:hypothetical protein
MSHIKQLIQFSILSALLFACGEGSIETGEFGSTCYLNDLSLNQPFLNTFSGKVATGTLTSLSLGECSDVAGEAQLVEAQSSNEEILTVTIVENNLQLSALSEGIAVLTISREGGDDVTFEIESRQANQVKITDSINNKSMVLGSSYETFVQYYHGDEFLSGYQSWAEQAVTSEGITIEDIAPAQIKITASGIGDQTFELGDGSIAVSVVDLTELSLSLETLISSAEGALVSILLADQSDREVISVTDDFVPEIIVSDDSMCVAQAAESSTVINVESNGAEECELTVKFNEQSVSHTVQFMDLSAE